MTAPAATIERSASHAEARATYDRVGRVYDRVDGGRSRRPPPRRAAPGERTKGEVSRRGLVFQEPRTYAGGRARRPGA